MKFVFIKLLLIIFSIEIISSNKINKSNVEKDDKKVSRINKFENELKTNKIESNSMKISDKIVRPKLSVVAENDEYIILKKGKNNLKELEDSNLQKKISKLIKNIGNTSFAKREKEDEDDDDDDKKKSGIVNVDNSISNNSKNITQVVAKQNDTNSIINSSITNNENAAFNKPSVNNTSNSDCNSCNNGINVVVFDVELDKPKNIPVVSPKIITSRPTIYSKTVVRKSVELSSPTFIARQPIHMPHIINRINPKTTVTPLSRDSYGLPVYTTTLGPTVAVVHSG